QGRKSRRPHPAPPRAAGRAPPCPHVVSHDRCGAPDRRVVENAGALGSRRPRAMRAGGRLQAPALLPPQGAGARDCRPQNLMPWPRDAAHEPGAPIDAWLIPPDNPPQRVVDKRRQPMRLSALFEEFLTFLRVEQEAAPRSIETYGWCFRDFEAFTMQEIGGTVLVVHFTAERCRAYQYALAARGLKANSIRVRLATLGSFGKWAVRREKLDRNPLD